MRFTSRVLAAGLCLSAGSIRPASAQAVAPQTPPGQQAAKPAHPHRSAESRATEHRTPVIEPRRSSHPNKSPPRSGVPPATAVVPPPPAPVPPSPPAETPSDQGAEKGADKAAETEKPEAAKLPRFVSLRSDDVNMRVGPGTRYRIEWVYKRRDLPVEIQREYDVWRWVQDPEGTQGWVHQATLMGRRTFIVQHADATLRRDSVDTSQAVAVLKVGVIGRIRSCEATSAWCYVQVGSYRGYLRREQFWGTLPGEAISP